MAFWKLSSLRDGRGEGLGRDRGEGEGMVRIGEKGREWGGKWGEGEGRDGWRDIRSRYDEKKGSGSCGVVYINTLHSHRTK